MIALAIVAVVVIYAIVIYNGLVRARQMKEEAWSGIDVQLKRRADLIPNLIETVKGYAAHEKETLEKVVELRNRAQALPAGDVAGRAQAEGMLSQALGRLFALAEAYPDLKANQNFLELQRELTDTEEKIAYARQFYNSNVLSYNTKTQTVPTVFIANMFGFTQEEFFEVEDEADRRDVTVNFSTVTPQTPSPPASPPAPPPTGSQ